MTDTPTLDPSWPIHLREIFDKRQQIDRYEAALAAVNAEMDALVREAIDEGERYQDIAKAADRSVPWVQTVLRRLGVEGPRVRVITARAERARKLDDAEAAERIAKRAAKRVAKAYGLSDAEKAAVFAAEEVKAQNAEFDAAADAYVANYKAEQVVEALVADADLADMMP